MSIVHPRGFFAWAEPVTLGARCQPDFQFAVQQESAVRRQYPHEGKLGHATLKMNGGEVMLSDEFDETVTGVRSPQSLGGTTSTVTLNVDNADRWFNRAVEAGATVVRSLNDEFYGRSGKVRDPFGHTWGIVSPTSKVV